MSPRGAARTALAALAAAALALGAAPAAQANTYFADPAADGNDTFAGDGQCIDSFDPLLARCSLRAAIQESNALPLSQRIELQAASYKPATPLPAIAGDTEIVGAGARLTTLDGGGHGRVLEAVGGRATVSDLTITGGIADSGGGVRNAGAELTLARAAIVGNVARAPTGAYGGGIENSSGKLSVLWSFVGGNRAEPASPGPDGGDAFGGGISSQAPLFVAHTTVHGNVARAAQGSAMDKIASGGGIGVQAGLTDLHHVTLSDNLADGGGQGGNLYVPTGAPVTLRDSVLVGGSDGVAAENCAGGTPQTLPWNIDSGTTCGFAGGGIPNTDPLLAPLGAYGGPTDSRPPLYNSRALAAAGNCSAGRDQRGFAIGAVCSIGAVERSSDTAAAISASRSPVPAGGELTLSVSASSAGLDASAATNATLSLPSGVTLVSVSAPGSTCLNRAEPGPALVCQLSSPAVGQVLAATVRAPASGTLTFTGTVYGDLGESAAANDSASVTVPVLAAAAQTPPTTTARRCATTRRGTSKANRMNGTAGSDRILGGGGKDRIDGRAGEDCLFGQDGNDSLIGGAGRDDLSGGAGSDRISARDGKRDTITCGRGRDRVTADSFDRIASDCESRRRS